MSRTLTAIYNEAVETRNKYLQLTELTNDSKMSIINAFTWVAAASIFSFETLLDVFMTDIATTFNSRINGTANYYANSMLKWQYGDNLVVNEDGTSFSYPQIDQSKRIISHVSYQEIYQTEYKDDVLVLKVATGEGEKMDRLSDEELVSARAYLNQIKFAGVKCKVVSRKGDVLIPRLTVYYDGAISKEELYDAIDASLTKYITGIQFDSLVYTQKVIDAIQRTEHVTDVYINPNAPVPQGVFLAQYDDVDVLSEPKRVDRKMYTSSGYLKQSSKKGLEASLPTFREALILELETNKA